MRAAAAILRRRGGSTLFGRALVIAAIAAGASCGISSIAPYNPDGSARTGSGGTATGTGAVASGGAGMASSGGQGGKPAGNGSGGQAAGGRGGATTGGLGGAATGGPGGQTDAGSGGRGGQIGGATGGTSGPGTGGSANGGGGSPGTGGASGTGGAMPRVCRFGDQQCSGNDVQTCDGTAWSSTKTCSAHQSCTMQASATALCACKADPVCRGAGSSCISASTIASCSQDSDGCFYQTGSSMCTTGSCTAGGASASCCACTANGPQCAVGGTSQACASGVVCGRAAPTACTDVNWAQWPMPNGPNDVSNGAPNAESYTDNGDGTVTDKVTGLMWQQASFGPNTWSEAMAHCPTLSLGGHNDWRLPARIELLSLVDEGIVGTTTTAMINPTYFPTVLSAYYWTSTPWAVGPPSQAWFVTFFGGGAGYIEVTTKNYGLCVR